MKKEIDFIARDITQKTLQIWKGKGKKIRPKLGDYVHLFELQNRIIGCLFFTPGMKPAFFGAGKKLGRATASYLTLCADIAESIDKFRKIKSLDEARTSDLMMLLKSFFKINKSGILELKEFNEKTIVFEIEECAECYGLVRIGEPICYFTVGYLDGLMSVFLDEEVRGYERKCCSTGDTKCEIVVKIVKK